MLEDEGRAWLAGVAGDIEALLREMTTLARVQGPAAEALARASREVAASAREPGQVSGPRAWAGASRRWAEELTADVVAEGVSRALRHQQEDWLSGPTQRRGYSGVAGTGYGRMGATLTGRGERSQTYGAIGGAIGYAIAGPAGAFVLGALGGLLGGKRDRSEQQQARAWLNTPEEFEIQAYLYNLARTGAGQPSVLPGPWRSGEELRGKRFGTGASAPVVQVQIAPGAIQITGQGEEAGQEAARAFAGQLGRALLLNSVLAPAAGWVGDL